MDLLGVPVAGRGALPDHADSHHCHCQHRPVFPPLTSTCQQGMAPTINAHLSSHCFYTAHLIPLQNAPRGQLRSRSDPYEDYPTCTCSAVHARRRMAKLYHCQPLRSLEIGETRSWPGLLTLCSILDPLPRDGSGILPALSVCCCLGTATQRRVRAIGDISRSPKSTSHLLDPSSRSLVQRPLSSTSANE
jgi:hypothetical protein